MSFKDQHPEFQQFARELTFLNNYNVAVLEGREDGPFRLFAQCALAFTALEAFLRILPGVQVSPEHTLSNLLDRASGKNLKLIRLEDRERAIALVSAARNIYLHGRFTDEEISEPSNVMCGVFLAIDLVRFVGEVAAQIDPVFATSIPSAPAAALRGPLIQPRAFVGVLCPEDDLEGLRAHNKACEDPARHHGLLLLAEGALTLMLLERSCRFALGDVQLGDGKDNFRGVLMRAVLGAPPRLAIDAADRADAIERIIEVRNTLAHANYEQAATGSSSASVADYFGSSKYISEVDRLYWIYRSFERQREQT